ncbi:MAG: AarF/UbiB family protein [Anaerolineaceae bacterium]|nr:AarF/UbiB family protein [Anaerolineaceae bacterium]
MKNSAKLSKQISAQPPENLRKQQKNRPGIMARIPSRQFITAEKPEVTPPMMQTVTFPLSFTLVLRRLFIWIFAGISFLTGIFWDWLRGRNTEAHRAMRLRRVLEREGGTFRKFGQLLAMQIDLLPWAYCVEMAQTLNFMKPFPIEMAIERIEVTTRAPLAETFDQFDPEPILSTPMSCVYQAHLKDGRKVAVEVERPGIGKVFSADLKILDWILDIGEFLSILRPGFTENFRRDLRQSIEEELNLSIETRHQSLFRSEAKKSGKKFFTAPQVYHEFCSSDVIIQEFTAGMWLWELIAAVELNDENALARAKELNIDPDLVAKRLLWVNFWEIDEHIRFRADLSPDNVIVRKNSKLTFIDFSSIGSLSQEKRQALQQTMHYAWKRDPLEMARASMVLLEPLPPIDIIKYTKDLEAIYWKFIYALESKHSEWWERSSAGLWLGFVHVARENNITMNIHVLRMIRARLLYDTIVGRLSPKIDHVKEYHKFTRYRAGAARKRMEKRIKLVYQQGIGDQLYMQVEEIVDTSERLFHQLQRFLSTPMMKFSAVLDKSVYSLATLFKLLGQSALVTAVAIGIAFSVKWFGENNLLRIVDALLIAVSNRIYQITILILLIVNIRAIMFRLSDKDS